MNGATDVRSGYKVCGYHGPHCNGLRTSLDDSHTQSRAQIWHNGQYESIVSLVLSFGIDALRVFGVRPNDIDRIPTK
jgi:hypothetical protein